MIIFSTFKIKETREGRYKVTYIQKTWWLLILPVFKTVDVLEVSV